MEDSNIIEALKPHLSSIRTPVAGDKVFKDQCAFSFDSPVSLHFDNANVSNVLQSYQF